jgi:hypothetical protein
MCGPMTLSAIAPMMVEHSACNSLSTALVQKIRQVTRKKDVSSVKKRDHPAISASTTKPDIGSTQTI